MTILVLDLGSSSVRAKLFDESIRDIPGGSVSRAYQFTTTPPGAATVDPEILRGLTEACVDEILQHPAAAHIRVVAMAAFTGTLVGLSSSGQPLTPLYTYAETRSADDVVMLNSQIDAAAAHQRTGCVNHTAYLPAKLHWLRRTQPALFEKVTQWADIGAYLYRRWFGNAASSYSLASWSGLLNRKTLGWDQEWLAALKLDAGLFTTLGDYDQLQQGLVNDYARRWPALRNVPFCLAVGDGAAANVGSGAVDNSRIGLTVGTTAALRVVTDAEMPVVPEGLWSYRLDARHHVMGGATIEGGNIFRWARNILQLPDETTIEDELAHRSADAHGLTALPLLGGERSPGWAADATGSIIGLRFSTTPMDLLQAALEGVALRLALIVEQLAPLAAPDAAFMAGGGSLSASPAWTQIIANAINQPLRLVEEPEATARGAALLSAQALGLASLTDYPPAIQRIFYPQPEQASALRAARARQVDLYHKTVR